MDGLSAHLFKRWFVHRKVRQSECVLPSRRRKVVPKIINVFLSLFCPAGLPKSRAEERNVRWCEWALPSIKDWSVMTQANKGTHTHTLMKRASFSCCNFLCVVLAAAYMKYRRCRLSCLPFVWHFFHCDTHTHTHTHTHAHTHTHTHSHSHTSRLIVKLDMTKSRVCVPVNRHVGVLVGGVICSIPTRALAFQS